MYVIVKRFNGSEEAGPLPEKLEGKSDEEIIEALLEIYPAAKAIGLSHEPRWIFKKKKTKP